MAKIVPPAWPDRGSIFITPTTQRAGLHDPHTNPYVGWVVGNGDREFERIREIHPTKRAKRWVEERYSVLGWRNVGVGITMLAAVPKESTHG